MVGGWADDKLSESRIQVKQTDQVLLGNPEINQKASEQVGLAAEFGSESEIIRSRVRVIIASKVGFE